MQQNIRIKKPPAPKSVISFNLSKSSPLRTSASAVKPLCAVAVSVEEDVVDEVLFSLLEESCVVCAIEELVFIACPTSCILTLMTRPTKTNVKNMFKKSSIPVEVYFFVILNGQQAIKNGIKAPMIPIVTTASIK